MMIMISYTDCISLFLLNCFSQDDLKNISVICCTPLNKNKFICNVSVVDLKQANIFFQCVNLEINLKIHMLGPKVFALLSLQINLLILCH